jgi:hypothetical protein
MHFFDDLRDFSVADADHVTQPHRSAAQHTSTDQS